MREVERDDRGCDVIVWDGGNNDFPFIRPDLWITVTDPHRVGHETRYYPGEVNVRMADVVIINKIDSAEKKDVEVLRENIRKLNPSAVIVEADSPIRVDNPDIIRDRDVLVIEDGPTLTHGEMKFGAGVVAAREFGASKLVDPRPYLKGKLKGTYDQYPEIGPLLPAMGYGPEQLKDLESTINDVPCDGVVIATPIDLGRELNIVKPYTRVFYDLKETGDPDLSGILEAFIVKNGLKNAK